jgi:hypothetical protein
MCGLCVAYGGLWVVYDAPCVVYAWSMCGLCVVNAWSMGSLWVVYVWSMVIYALSMVVYGGLCRSMLGLYAVNVWSMRSLW